MMENCASCKFWAEFDEEGGEPIGTCKRFPPQRSEESQALFEAHGCIPVLAYSPREWTQPTTEHLDWCGEWRARD